MKTDSFFNESVTTLFKLILRSVSSSRKLVATAAEKDSGKNNYPYNVVVKKIAQAVHIITVSHIKSPFMEFERLKHKSLTPLC